MELAEVSEGGVSPQSISLEGGLEESIEAQSGIHISAAVELNICPSQVLPWKWERHKLSAKLQMSRQIRLPVVKHLECVMDCASWIQVEPLAFPGRAEDFVVEEPHVMPTFYILGMQESPYCRYKDSLELDSDAAAPMTELYETHNCVLKSISCIFVK